MVFLLDRDGLFVVKASDQGPDSGNGVFCVEDVKAGTILEYTGVVFKELKAPKDMDRVYTVACDYYNSKGKARTSEIYSIDGNPHNEPIASLKEHKKIGCQINEASRGGNPNCMFTTNPFLTKTSFKDAFTNQTVVTATLIVIVEDLSAGTELLTMYGDDYGDREYKPCKMKRKHQDIMIDKAYSFTDDLLEQSRVEQNQHLEEEAFTVPAIGIPDLGPTTSAEFLSEPNVEPSVEPETKKVRFEENM